MAAGGRRDPNRATRKAGFSPQPGCQEDAQREAGELLAQFTILYPTEFSVRSAIRGWATYRLPPMARCSPLWAYAHEYGLSDIYSEDFQHDRLYGTVRLINPFI